MSAVAWEKASLPGLRIAIVHEWFGTYAGSEQVVAAMLEVFPHADLCSRPSVTRRRCVGCR